MKSNPFLWLARYLSGFGTGWSIGRSAPLAQTLAFVLVMVVCLAIAYERDFNTPKKPAPLHDRLREHTLN